MNINWTAIILAGVMFIIGLFIPSPLDCNKPLPPSELIKDSVTVYKPSTPIQGNTSASPFIKSLKSTKTKQNKLEPIITKWDTVLTLETIDSLDGVHFQVRTTLNLYVDNDTLLSQMWHDYTIIPAPKEIQTITITTANAVDVPPYNPLDYRLVSNPIYESPVVVIPITAALTWLLTSLANKK